MKRYARLKIRSHKTKKSFWIFLFFGGVIGIYYFIFFSPFFLIQEILFVPPSKVFQQDLNNFFINKFKHFVPSFIFSLFPQYQKNYLNILFVNSTQLKNYFLNKYLTLQTVHIEEDLLHKKLIIKTVPRSPQYYFCCHQLDTSNLDLSNLNNQQKKVFCFYLDREGLVYSEAPFVNNLSLNTIVLQNQEIVSLGEKLLSSSDWQTINSIFTLTKKDDSPLKVKYLEFPRKSPTWIEIVTTDNWRVKINLKDDFSFLLEVIKQFQQQNNPYIFRSLKYLDLRFLPQITYSLY